MSALDFGVYSTVPSSIFSAINRLTIQTDLQCGDGKWSDLIILHCFLKAWNINLLRLCFLNLPLTLSMVLPPCPDDWRDMFCNRVFFERTLRRSFSSVFSCSRVSMSLWSASYVSSNSLKLYIQLVKKQMRTVSLANHVRYYSCGVSLLMSRQEQGKLLKLGI